MIEKQRARFSMRIELFAAFDGLELPSREQLRKRNFRDEMKKLLEQMEGMDPKQLEKEVYARFEFDLCRKCRDELLKQLEERKYP